MSPSRSTNFKVSSVQKLGVLSCFLDSFNAPRSSTKIILKKNRHGEFFYATHLSAPTWLILSQITPKGPLINNYHSTLRLIVRLMMSKKAFVMKHYFILILSDEIKYHTFLHNYFANTCVTWEFDIFSKSFLQENFNRFNR